MTHAKRQQRLSLSASATAFAICFAAWTLFSILGVEIREQLDLNYTQFALLLVAPIVTGALARLPAGILADIYGGRRVMFYLMLIVGVVMLAFPYAHSYGWYLVLLDNRSWGFVPAPMVLPAPGWRVKPIAQKEYSSGVKCPGLGPVTVTPP